MRVAIKISLSKIEKQELEKNTRSRSVSIRLSERSKIILLAAEGMENKAIAQKLGIPPNRVGLWRNRFADGGIKALSKDKPRGANHGGKSSRQQARLRNKIIKKTTQEKPANATHWSTRTLAEELNTTHSFVNRVWNSVGLKPHLEKTFKVSNDPHFEEKLCDVVGLYLNPPEHAIVFCVDEKTSIQALDRTQPGLPLKKGRCGTLTHDYKRNGISTLFAALDVATGAVTGECYQKHTHKEFLTFLKKVEKQTEKDKDLHIIVDNYATHKHEKVKKWLKRNKRVFLHFIPTSSSWLNLVERFFGVLTQKQLKRGVFTSVEELKQKIHEYIETNNKHPKPFVWTRSLEEILEKVNRARSTLDNIGTV
ncbi:MAG: IS630 family transposase [Candidatus Thiodiazotropha sp. (ex Dulcina madagascariensis)]|nr:IS630 family transposase [Candidatus Thiodiazotropha sp. (ex Dulcina madagascariensis)]